MRGFFLVCLLIVAFSTHALQSIRVGNQVLVVGDSVARVKALLGEPSVRVNGGSDHGNLRKKAFRTSAEGKQRKGAEQRWQYWRDGHATTFFIGQGKITRIEDAAR